MLTNIFILGFSGSGKTSVGGKLAEKLKIRFYDTDELIEKKNKLTITQIFVQKGEMWFREQEKIVVSELLNNKYPKIVSLGGGTFQNSKLRNKIIKSGITIYLSCSQKELYNRTKINKSRPLLGLHSSSERKKKIKSLILKRIDNYRKADYTVSTTDKTINEVVNKISGIISNAENNIRYK